MELCLWPISSAASGSPQVACCTHSLCVWPWGLGVRSPKMVNKVAQSLPSRPPQAWRSPGLCLGKNQHSVAGSQGGAGCFIHGGPGGMHTGRGWGSWLDLEPGGVGWARACRCRDVWLNYPET